MAAAERNAGHILVVDDNVSIARLLSQMLGAAGYQVCIACDGEEALQRIGETRLDLVLLDLDLPRMGGFEVCRRIKGNPATGLLPVLILTGRSAAETRLRAWEIGADDFLNKPFQSVEVLARCRSLVRVKRLVDELDTAQAVVFALVRTIEAKCPYTLGHTERVSAHAVALARLIGLPEMDSEVLRQGALLHDIGKISIPDAILNKPGPLTADEYALVKTHPMQGCRIVEPLRSLRDALPFIRWHHERMDGQGYPDGLASASIPMPVRILAVADVYDALRSERPYRGSLPHAECMALLRSNAAGGGLDPELVRPFTEEVAGQLLTD